MRIEIVKEGSIAFATLAYKESWDNLSNATYVVDIKNASMRTSAQNRALHLWCTQIADVLNQNNIKMQGIFSEIDWTMEIVKTVIIKQLISSIFGKNSTTKLLRKEIDEMIDYVVKAFATKGVEIPSFPSRELWNV